MPSKRWPRPRPWQTTTMPSCALPASPGKRRQWGGGMAVEKRRIAAETENRRSAPVVRWGLPSPLSARCRLRGSASISGSEKSQQIFTRSHWPARKAGCARVPPRAARTTGTWPVDCRRLNPLALCHTTFSPLQGPGSPKAPDFPLFSPLLGPARWQQKVPGCWLAVHLGESSRSLRRIGRACVPKHTLSARAHYINTTAS